MAEDIKILKPVQAMALLNVSRSWLYAAAKDERIPSFHIGGPDGPLRFVESELLDHIEQARQRWRPGQRAGDALRDAD